MAVAEINGKSLDDIAKINEVTVIGLGDALVGEVMDGKFFYAGSTTLLEGTLATVALSAASGAYPAGYHAGNVGGLVAIDEHLVAGEIKKDTVIFGVTGTFENTLGTTELFFEKTKSNAGVEQAYVDCTDLDGEVPANAERVLAVLAATSTGVFGDARILYNAVEKVTEDTHQSVPYNCRWEGEGIGSAAILKFQVKVDSGSVVVYSTGGCWYQTLT